MTENSEIEVIKNQFVCLIDVLGFKSKFEEIGLEEIYKIYKELLEHIASNSMSFGVYEFGGVKSLVGGVSYKYSYFSDTILISTDELNYSVLNITTINLNELICKSIELNFPLRGGISIGNAIIEPSKNIFLGQPIISAHLAESSQVGIGIAHSSYINYPMSISTDLIIPYKQHLKPNTEQYIGKFILDFPAHWRKTRKTDLIELITKNKMSQKIKDEKEREIINRYYDNTIEICKYSKKVEDCQWVDEYINSQNK